MTTCIDIIRHGEPVGGRRYRGHSVDDPLTEKGWRQMQASVPDSPRWQHVISSPLKRCLAFSRQLANDLNIPCSVVDDFREIGFGEWEGKTPDEILARDSDALLRFYQDPVNNRPEGAESLSSFSERVWRAYQNIAEKHKGQHVLVVAHAGVSRAVIANILKMSLCDVYSLLKIEYGSLVHSSIEDGMPPKLIFDGPR